MKGFLNAGENRSETTAIEKGFVSLAFEKKYYECKQKLQLVLFTTVSFDYSLTIVHSLP